MPSYTCEVGRYCNRVLRNLAMHHVAQKHNLKVVYASKEWVARLGIPQFSGELDYPTSKVLSDGNFFEMLNADSVEHNMDGTHYYFQSPAISRYNHAFVREPAVMEGIKSTNPFRERYDNNNDVCLHIRLGDADRFNPGAKYYLNALQGIQFDRMYIATDSWDHPVIKEIRDKYPQAEFADYDEVQTLQFGSTCRHLIVSHGSYSFVMGILAFHADVYYPRYEDGKIWFGDMFVIDSWKRVDF